jgi:hypothetical protein
MLILWIFGVIYLIQKRAIDVEKQRYLPCECLISMFLLCQFLFNFPLFNYAVEACWLAIGNPSNLCFYDVNFLGVIVYIMVSWKRL